MKKNQFPEVVSFRISQADKQQFETLVPQISKSEFFRSQLKRVINSKKVRQ